MANQIHDPLLRKPDVQVQNRHLLNAQRISSVSAMVQTPAGQSSKWWPEPIEFPSEFQFTALSRQTEADKLSTLTKFFESYLKETPKIGVVLLQRTDGAVLVPSTEESETQVKPTIHPILGVFAESLKGVLHSDNTLEKASRIIHAAVEKATAKEIGVDATDGALSFELRTSKGYLVSGELSIDGELQVNVYNDRHTSATAPIEDIWIDYMPHASAEDVIGLL